MDTMSSKVISKVAILNDKFHGGGTERLLSYMSDNFLSKNEGIILLFDNSKIDFNYSGQLVSLGVKPPPYSDIFQESFYLLKALLKLFYIKRKHKLQICISQKEGSNFINVLSSSSKSIVTVHEPKSAGIKYKGLKRLAVKYLIKYLYNKADYVVTVSDGVARDLAENFGINIEKLKTIYNPCDIDMIERKLCEPIEDKYINLLDGPVIITAGRLETPKGHWHLIRAFKEVKKQINAVKLIILGVGDHLKYLQNLAVQLKVEDSIYFLGYQQNPFSLISRANVFVLSSLWEGFGAVITEAMSCKVPVISTDCPYGPREILAPDSSVKAQAQGVEFAKYGILTPPLDGVYKSANDPLTYGEKALAEAIIRVLEDPDLCKKYISLGYARAQEFSMEKYIAQWNELIASV
jgi:glycosyltransferase involved in cell wall biosynthesis